MNSVHASFRRGAAALSKVIDCMAGSQSVFLKAGQFAVKASDLRLRWQAGSVHHNCKLAHYLFSILRWRRSQTNRGYGEIMGKSDPGGIAIDTSLSIVKGMETQFQGGRIALQVEIAVFRIDKVRVSDD